MAQAAMPFLVLALGSEMVYILEQRLRAQNVPDDKARRVLGDIGRTLLASKFIEELFRPQECYTTKSLRTIFERIAHSSIMRLSESSMDKLFDLMVMGAKYQLIASAKPKEVMGVANLHLSECGHLFDDKTLQKTVDEVTTKLKRRYANFTDGDWHAVRRALCDCLQDRKVKVSLFLHESIQTADGRIAVPAPSRTGASGRPVGSVTTPGAKDATVHLASYDDNEGLYFDHPVPLGGNLYAKDRKVVVPTTAPTGGADESAEDDMATQSPGGGTAASPPLQQRDSATSTWRERSADPPTPTSELKAGSGDKELNLLSALMGVAPGKDAPKDNFKLNLFGDDRGGGATRSDAKGKGAVSIEPRGPSVVTLSVDGKRDTAAHRARVADSLKGLDLSGSASARHNTTAEDEADLLDLLGE